MWYTFRMQSTSKAATYAEQQDNQNTLKMRAVLAELPGFLKQYFRGIADRTSARTRLAYAYDLHVFFTFMQENNPELAATPLPSWPLSVLERITKEDIEEFLEYTSYYQKEEKTLTNGERGKARKLSALRSMYKYFYHSELIAKDVATLVDMPKLHEKPIIRMEPDEVATLLDQVEGGVALTKSQLKYHNRTKIRDVAMLTLLLGTGIRVSECVGLDIKDVNFRENGIRVHRKGGADAIVYFSDEVAGALQEYMEQRLHTVPADGHEEALFLSLQNKRMNVRSVEKMVKKYASLVTTMKKITPHKLRSTYGTSLYRETGDIYLVADVLGHKDVNTTRKHYAAIEEDRRRRAANVVKLREEISSPSSSDKLDSKEEPQEE